MKLERDRIINSTKAAIGCLAGLFILALTHDTYGQWVIVTILVIMCRQIRLGSAIRKSYSRALGALIGSAISITTLLSAPNDYVTYGIVLVIAVLLFSYFASGDSALSEGGTFGAITISVVLFAHQASIHTAIIRTIEILSGIAIAVIIARLVYPIHAKQHLRESVAKNLSNFAKLFGLIITKAPSHEKICEIQAIEDEITAEFPRQKELISEAASEPTKIVFDKMLAKRLITHQRRLYRSIVMIHQATHLSTRTHKEIRENEAMEPFAVLVTDYFEKCAQALKTRKAPKSPQALQQAIPSLCNIFESHISELSQTEAINVHTIEFSLQEIANELSALGQTIRTLEKKMLSRKRAKRIYHAKKSN